MPTTRDKCHGCSPGTVYLLRLFPRQYTYGPGNSAIGVAAVFGYSARHRSVLRTPLSPRGEGDRFIWGALPNKSVPFGVNAKLKRGQKAQAFWTSLGATGYAYLYGDQS